MQDLTKRFGVMPALILGVALCAIGLLTLQQIVNNWWPVDVARIDLIRNTAQDRIDASSLLEAANTEVIVAFLGAILVTLTGIFLPLAHFLNKRFGRETTFPPLLVTLRQAMWVGLWGAFCTWLQMNRTFGIAIASLAAFFFLLLEVMVQIRTQVAQTA